MPQQMGAQSSPLDSNTHEEDHGFGIDVYKRQAWNGQGTLDWPDFAASLSGLKAPMRQWAKTLAARPDLAGKLVQFCLERLK